VSDSSNPNPLLGKVLEGRYRVDELVARGGMATVYRGTDLRLGRIVALKVLGICKNIGCTLVGSA
jgi:serine/threonine-protein kinase